MTFQFRKLTARDIPQLARWLREPHVAEFWQESDNEADLHRKFITELPGRGVEAFVIVYENQPIGFIQRYEAAKVGGGWWPGVAPGVFGIDQFIGENDFINRGFGTALVRQFTSEIFAKSSVTKIITDPDPKNLRAIRAYEKAGFVKDAEITTPGGAALLMSRLRPES